MNAYYPVIHSIVGTSSQHIILQTNSSVFLKLDTSNMHCSCSGINNEIDQVIVAFNRNSNSVVMLQ